MSKKSAYEDALSGKPDEFPLPDEDASWQKMKQLLDDDDRAAPFVFWKDFRVMGLLMILLVWSGFALMNEDLDKRDKEAVGGKQALTYQKPGTGEQQSEIGNQRSGIESRKSATGDQQANQKLELLKRGTAGFGDSNMNDIPAGTITSRASRNNNSPAGSDPSQTGADLSKIKVESLKRAAKQLTQGAKKQHSRNTKPAIKNSDEKYTRDNSTTLADPLLKSAGNNARTGLKPVTDKTNPVPGKPADSASSKAIEPDSITAKTSNSPSPDTMANQKQIVKLSKPSSHKYLLSAGLGVHQQIQVGGQQSVKYGYNAASLVSDYIPSVWINFEKKNRWFVQTGFVYSSPQLVKEFAFNRQTKADTFTTVTNTLSLKKTFYSQLPLSLNYYIKPHFSLGAGLTVTWLRGAIAEKETSIKNTSSQSPVVQREIVPIKGFTDSFLYRSHSFLTLQGDYQWNRVSLGLRYNKDLQSYIKYTRPDGSVLESRNWGLQAVVRIRLWRKELN